VNEETESNAEADTTIKGDLIDKRLLTIKFESSYHEVEKTGVCEMENQKSTTRDKCMHYIKALNEHCDCAGAQREISGQDDRKDDEI
jgi:hypothetical protein